MRYIINFYWKINDVFGVLWRKIEKKFGIPNVPKALPMRFFEDEDDKRYCWEDFHKESKKKYPVRFFIFNTLDRKIQMMLMKYVENPLVWINSMYFKKYHIIDLRGSPIADYTGTYKGGYIDPSTVLEMSMFKSFQRYIQELEINDGFIEDQISKLEYSVQNYTGTGPERFEYSRMQKDLEVLKRMQEIKHFIIVTLPEMQQEESDLFSNDSRVKETKQDVKKRYEKQKSLEASRELMTTEILCDIVNLRKNMWT
jgi:hypothetical protein